MTDETGAGQDSSPDRPQPMVLLSQDGVTVTLVPNGTDEYDVVLGTAGGGSTTLAWFEAMIVGRALAAAGEAAGAANHAWRTQSHVEEWTLWLADQLGIGQDPVATPDAGS